MAKKQVKSEYFINRELSWLEFNQRVLEEAQDTSTPLLERCRFLSIVSSNLDEFFMVRVASLYEQMEAGFSAPDASGKTPAAQLKAINSRVHTMSHDQYNLYKHGLLPALKREGIRLLKLKELSVDQKAHLRSYYEHEIFPVLTPIVVDQSRPFPLIYNKSLNLAVLLEGRSDEEATLFATVEVPSLLDRLVEVPDDNGGSSFVFLEDVIRLNIRSLFKGHKVLATGAFRVIRDADLDVEDDEVDDLLLAIQQSVKERKWGAVVRLVSEHKIDPRLLVILREEMEVPPGSDYPVNGPLDLGFLGKLANLHGFNHLCFPPQPGSMQAVLFEEGSIFDAIAEQDILLHHPYNSFQPVIDFLREAAEDPRVLAIKSTLYRVSGQSPVVEALAAAAENGKQVTVLVELKARFDEQNNITWARRLEMAGCHVVYGVVGLKTHCKLLLVVRREDNGIKRYLHLGTGNYNDVTARAYVDLGLFTCNAYMAADASALFNLLTGYSQPGRLYKMHISPKGLRRKILAHIEGEIAQANSGGQARIVAKVNSLVDQDIIQALYAASRAGVEIDLIVRSMCSLRPGLPGVSDRIRVRSIVGRWLEHSRIFFFCNGGEESIYLSSADWRERNLDRRIEVLFPVENPDIKEEVKSILAVYLQDTVKARCLKSDGSWERIDRRGKEAVNSQAIFAIRSKKGFIPDPELMLGLPPSSLHAEAMAAAARDELE